MYDLVMSRSRQREINKAGKAERIKLFFTCCGYPMFDGGGAAKLIAEDLKKLGFGVTPRGVTNWFRDGVGPDGHFTIGLKKLGELKGIVYRSEWINYGGQDEAPPWASGENAATTTLAIDIKKQITPAFENSRYAMMEKTEQLYPKADQETVWMIFELGDSCGEPYRKKAVEMVLSRLTEILKTL